MGLYEPKSCCICFNTKHGSLILASLSLIGSILFILAALSGPHTFFFDVLLENIVRRIALHLHVKDNIILPVCIGVLIGNSLVGVCSCLLIHGIRKDHPGLMLPYLVFQRTCIIIKIITILIAIGLALYLQDQHNLYHGALVLIIATIINTYCHLFINAYHKQVKRAVSEEHHILPEEFNNDDNDYKVKVHHILPEKCNNDDKDYKVKV